MKLQSRSIMAIFLAGLWINVSEFFRNQVLLLRYWVEHFASVGMTFPTATVNGIVWMILGFVKVTLFGRGFDLAGPNSRRTAPGKTAL